MINSLYEPFKKWSDGGSVWLISDPHFDDKESVEYNGGYVSALSPQEYVDELNKKIFKSDTLICLGDCGNEEWFKKIRAGYKVLIKGNHDKNSDEYYKRKVIEKIFDKDEWSSPRELREHLQDNGYKDYLIDIWETYSFHSPFERYVAYIDNNMFDEVYSGALFIAPQILLSHEPVNGLTFCTNINGHSHMGLHKYWDEQGGRHLNIAADVVGYQPINLGKLIKDGLVAGLPTIHRQTIDRAIEKKKVRAEE